MVWKAQEGEVIEGFQLSTSSLGVPILQLADDALLLTKGGLEEARGVRNMLSWFEACSGLRMNVRAKFTK